MELPRRSFLSTAGYVLAGMIGNIAERLWSPRDPVLLPPRRRISRTFVEDVAWVPKPVASLFLVTFACPPGLVSTSWYVWGVDEADARSKFPDPVFVVSSVERVTDMATVPDNEVAKWCPPR